MSSQRIPGDGTRPASEPDLGGPVFPPGRGAKDCDPASGQDMVLHAAIGRCSVRTEVAADAGMRSISSDVGKICFGDTPRFVSISSADRRDCRHGYSRSDQINHCERTRCCEGPVGHIERDQIPINGRPNFGPVLLEFLDRYGSIGMGIPELTMRELCR